MFQISTPRTGLTAEAVSHRIRDAIVAIERVERKTSAFKEVWDCRGLRGAMSNIRPPPRSQRDSAGHFELPVEDLNEHCAEVTLAP